jgi:hypothetical protein
MAEARLADRARRKTARRQAKLMVSSLAIRAGRARVLAGFQVHTTLMRPTALVLSLSKDAPEEAAADARRRRVARGFVHAGASFDKLRTRFQGGDREISSAFVIS